MCRGRATLGVRSMLYTMTKTKRARPGGRGKPLPYDTWGPDGETAKKSKEKQRRADRAAGGEGEPSDTTTSFGNLEGCSGNRMGAVAGSIAVRDCDEVVRR